METCGETVAARTAKPACSLGYTLKDHMIYQTGSPEATTTLAHCRLGMLLPRLARKGSRLSA